MVEHIIPKDRFFAILPPEWPDEGLLAVIQKRIKASQHRMIVLDDDPTGTQTVHNLPVLTAWSAEAIAAELKKNYPACFILTNSRSLTTPEANRLGAEIGRNLLHAAETAKVDIQVISRSDSTLRGHFPGEVKALQKAMQTTELPCLIIPFFLEGGRYTVDDIHYVAEDDRLLPAAETAYAQDAVFGYRHSNLRRWVAEKTKGRIPCDEVASISLDDIRRGGPARVAKLLASLEPASCCVVNAASYRDLEVFVAGLLDAEDLGKRYIFRTAASFVRVRCGISPQNLVDHETLTASTATGGLFVVGSYVPQTTRQLEALRRQTSTVAVEVSVEDLLDADQRSKAITRCTEKLQKTLRQGMDAVLYTSRDLVQGQSDSDNLKIGQIVSNSLIAITRSITCQPRYLVAKGGITSSDLATKGLSLQRAMVMGQVLPGVPVWKLGPEARFPGMAYIIFPGNVGQTNDLVRIQQRLSPKE